MTRTDVHDDVCDEPDSGTAPPAFDPGRRAEVLPSRDVPLGGLRGMTVSRSLPQREVPTIGAWCFLDRFGPQRTTMRVEPHPHIGLQTVTWPLTGEIRHRDSIGSDVVLRPGALNLMTSGHGISHSEYSLTEEPIDLDALQLWVALPEHVRHGDHGFESHSDLPEVVLEAPQSTASRHGADAVAVVVMGTFAGATSPATTHTPIVGAELSIPAGATVRLPLDSAWEHGLALIDGDMAVRGDDGAALPDITAGDILYLGNRRPEVTVSTTGGARVFLLGGEPFPDDLVMWWNFVGRSHDEVAEARRAWEAREPRFGHVVGHGQTRVPAPPMPEVRLTPRRRRPVPD
ncbi:pirin family protein [Demequina aestuarii]|uniref:pirin family protein n=1 Tax=Demequina aestuarii TaxID=327095 RepID=UPI00078666E0|nr:pirin family protein [Demequina aestuarii]